MTSQPSSDSSRPPRSSRSLGGKPKQSRWWVVSVAVLLLIGFGFLIAGFGASVPKPAQASASAGAIQTPAVTTGRPAVVPVSSVPVSLRIPAIGVSVSLSKLGLNADRSPQVPTKYQEPGWYKLGPAPGMMGSAVILGHVDDKKGPAVFYKLGSLRPGDKVELSLASGAVAHFAVKAVETYLKTQFPSQKVYGPHGYRALQLVTCGGTFDNATGHYLSNVVAYTALVSTTPAQK
jgi:hypothetical protein